MSCGWEPDRSEFALTARRLFIGVGSDVVPTPDRPPQHYSTFPHSLMVTLADVCPLREPTASIFLTTS